MKILLAIDGSKFGIAAAKKCCDLFSAKEDTQIKIVSVAEISRPMTTEPFGISNEFYLKLDTELARATEGFVADAKEIVEKELKDKVKIETSVLRGSPKNEIVEEAAEWGADLIVVGSHGYGFFERMLIGSVSNAVLHHAPCSVLIVKSKETVSEVSEE